MMHGGNLKLDGNEFKKNFSRPYIYSDALCEFHCCCPVENRLRCTGIDTRQYIYMNIVWIFVHLQV
jgi:hypothetical protein